MGRTETRLFYVFTAPRVGAGFAFGAVGDAESSLDDAVGTVGDGAFAAGSFGVEGWYVGVEGCSGGGWG